MVITDMSVCRIVLVEDNPADVLLVKEALNHHNVAFELELHSNGESAANAITAMSEVPALFLLDINIPRIDGLALLRLIRARSILDQVPAVILTSSRVPSDRTESERLGADAFLIKPTGYQVFLTDVGGAIAQLLQRKLPRACGGRHQLTKARRKALRTRSESRSSVIAPRFSRRAACYSKWIGSSG